MQLKYSECPCVYNIAHFQVQLLTASQQTFSILPSVWNPIKLFMTLSVTLIHRLIMDTL